MNSLQQLIRTRMGERGWSYGDVARRGGLPRSTVHHLATVERLRRPPHPDTLERLARGLELSLDDIRVSAAEAAGLAVLREEIGDPEVDVLVAGITRLSPEDRRHVAALIQSLLSADRPA